MLLVDRELIGDMLKAFAGLLMMILVIFFVEAFLSQYAEIFGSHPNGVYLGFLYWLTSLPGDLVDSFAILTAASVIWVVQKKARQNEILAYMAGGISPARLATPLLAGSMLVASGALALNYWVVPRSEMAAWQIDRVLNGRTRESVTRNQNIYQRGAERRFFVIDSYDSSTESMANPTIIDLFDDVNRPRWIMRAEEGRLVETADGPVWEFTNATVRRWTSDGTVAGFENVALLRDTEFDRRLEPRLNLFLRNLKDPTKMSFGELRETISVLDAQGKDVSLLVQDLHAKIALPLAGLFLTLVLCGHILRPEAQSVLVGLGGGLLWIVGYYGLFLSIREVARIADLPMPWIAAWAANGIYAVAGVVLLARRST